MSLEKKIEEKLNESLKNKDKSDLKNILRSMVFEMADDGYDEDDVLNLFEKLIYAEVKMLYKKAVK